jgi:hypothetical protein
MGLTSDMPANEAWRFEKIEQRMPKGEEGSSTRIPDESLEGVVDKEMDDEVVIVTRSAS